MRVPTIPSQLPILTAAFAAFVPAVPLTALADSELEVEDTGAEDLADLDLSDLMSIEVTSVAGVRRSLAQTPSAITVLQGDDLRRWGHQSLPEVLRLVPGLHVGRINSSMWSIGSRAFTGRFANSLLVLEDGRIVYDPLFSGTFWHAQDPILEDLDRVEVIRGPGATLWGSNAVNGVINVESRSAEDTQGLLIKSAVGSELLGGVALRYGGQLGEHTWARVWGKFDEHDTMKDAAGDDSHDDWSAARGGIRLDLTGADDVKLAMIAQGFNTPRIGTEGRRPVVAAIPTFTAPIGDTRSSGRSINARVSRETEASGWSLQSYYDHFRLDDQSGLEYSHDTFSLEYRHHMRVSESHDLMGGVGLRLNSDRTTASPELSFDPADSSQETFHGFIQDTITIVPDRLHAMLGTKLEHGEFSGFEIQPSARLWYTPDDQNTIWAAVSRAIHSPSRADANVNLTLSYADTGILGGGAPSGFIIPLSLTGNEDLESQELLAIETGWRTQFTDRLTLDLALFAHDYEHFITIPTGSVGQFTDEGSAEAFGAELSITWNAADNWRLIGSYGFSKTFIHGPVETASESDFPQQQCQLRSALDVTEAIELNTALYWVDEVPEYDADSYLRVDCGLVWRPRENVELGLWIQNLLDPQHPEAHDELFSTRTFEAERALVLSATIRF